MDSTGLQANAESISKQEEAKKEIISYFMSRDILISEDILNKLSANFDKERFYKWVNSNVVNKDFMLLNCNAIELLNNGSCDMNWSEFDKAKVLEEKGIDKDACINLMKIQEEARRLAQPNINLSTSLNVLFSYQKEAKKKEVMDFVCLFNKRFESIKKILMNRQELQSATSISRIMGKKERGQCSVIGTIIDKASTANNNIMLTLEDQTGTIKVFLGKNKSELAEISKELVLDEIIGVMGTSGDGIIFANSIILPEMPMHKEMKKAKDKCYAVFLSDLHVGSDKFLAEELTKFLQWIKGETGTDSQKEMAARVGYIFIIGDLVDGVGIYPEQDSELDIKDIYEQYDECAKFIKEIPERIKIIICPGNHDAVRISEPQPVLNREYARSLWALKNVTMVSNPALINIHSSPDFPGFDVLMYHGYSFDYYVANVDSIREKGGYDRADLIMKFLLRRRHLAPAYSSTLYVTDPEKDHLVIDKVPDMFVTGHIHKSYAANYRNITMISGSCWQSKTIFQEKVGHNPEPARVPIVDLSTRKVKILRFDK